MAAARCRIGVSCGEATRATATAPAGKSAGSISSGTWTILPAATPACTSCPPSQIICAPSCSLASSSSDISFRISCRGNRRVIRYVSVARHSQCRAIGIPSIRSRAMAVSASAFRSLLASSADPRPKPLSMTALLVARRPSANRLLAGCGAITDWTSSKGYVRWSR